MTNIIVNKVEKQAEDKKNKKLQHSHYKHKSKFKEGVLTLSKNFLKK